MQNIFILEYLLGVDLYIIQAAQRLEYKQRIHLYRISVMHLLSI